MKTKFLKNVHIACVQMCLELIMTLSKHKMTWCRVNVFDRDLLTLHNKTHCKTTVTGIIYLSKVPSDLH